METDVKSENLLSVNNNNSDTYGIKYCMLVQKVFDANPNSYSTLIYTILSQLRPIAHRNCDNEICSLRQYLS